MISDHVVAAFLAATVPNPWKGDELLRARLEAAFAQARREIAHEALKPPASASWDRDVVDRARPFMLQCGPCDYGLPEYGCNCPEGDFRPIVSDLVTEVERLRAELERSR